VSTSDHRIGTNPCFVVRICSVVFTNARLVALQLALLVLLAPPLANALQRALALGAFPDSALAIVQGALALAAIGGGALALAFPLLALLRHRQRGRARFGGLPRWAVVLAVAGGVVFVLGAVLNVAAPLVSTDARLATLLTARPMPNAGFAIMVAGVLCAEPCAAASRATHDRDPTQRAE
jgi:hypothetical protein